MTNNGHISANGIFGALEAWRLHFALFVVVTEKLKWRDAKMSWSQLVPNSSGLLRSFLYFSFILSFVLETKHANANEIVLDLPMSWLLVKCNKFIQNQIFRYFCVFIIICWYLYVDPAFFNFLSFRFQVFLHQISVLCPANSYLALRNTYLSVLLVFWCYVIVCWFLQPVPEHYLFSEKG